MDEEKIIEDARKIGVLDEVKARNLKIKKEFQGLQNNPDYKYEIAVQKLAEKYFLSKERIESIICLKNKI